MKLKLLACISLGAVWVIKQCLKSHIIMGRPPHFVWGFARYEVVRQRDVWFSPKHSLIWLPRFYVHSSMKTLWKHSTEGCLKETIHFYLNNSRLSTNPTNMGNLLKYMHPLSFKLCNNYSLKPKIAAVYYRCRALKVHWQ